MRCSWHDPSAPAAHALKLREDIQQAIERARQTKRIGSSVALTLPGPGKGFDHDVWNDLPTLEEFFILSELHITRDDTAT